MSVYTGARDDGTPIFVLEKHFVIRIHIYIFFRFLIRCNLVFFFAMLSVPENSARSGTKKQKKNKKMLYRKISSETVHDRYVIVISKLKWF